jgi:inhibitor of cysteine peptidase
VIVPSVHQQTVCSQPWVTYILAYLLSVILLLPAGCVGSDQGTGTRRSAVSTHTLTRDDRGKTVEIHIGDTLVMRLDENPTTGYEWALEAYNKEIVTLNSTVYIPSPPSAVGGGGQRIFTFKGERAGRVTLRFMLRRRWEGEASVLDDFAVILEVRG